MSGIRRTRDTQKHHVKPSRLKRLYYIYRDPQRKSMPRIFAEVICLSVMNVNFPPRYYTSRYLFKRFRSNIFDFYSDNFFSGINKFFNIEQARSVWENKLFSHLFLAQFKISTPRLLAHNHHRNFVIGDEVWEIRDKEVFKSFLMRLNSEIPNNDPVYIKKIWGSFGGDNVFRVRINQILSDSNDRNNLYYKIIDSEYLFQESLKQHPVIDSLNPSCANTVRIDTFIDKNGRAEVMSAYLRIGFKGSHVDNIAAGGISVPIDINTGCLNSFGYQPYAENWTFLPEEHPETKMRFEDIVIPFFDEVKYLACRSALLVPELRLMGWDIAIGERGPVMIEGNTFYDMAGVDMNYGGYRKNAIFQNVLSEYKRKVRF